MTSNISEKPVKKVTVRARHAEAIAMYEQWLMKFPKSSLEKRIRQFDFYVDTVVLNEMIRDK
jgi:hypothetical protein